MKVVDRTLMNTSNTKRLTDINHFKCFVLHPFFSLPYLHALMHNTINLYFKESNYYYSDNQRFSQQKRIRMD